MSAVALRDGREPGAALRWTVAALLIGGVHAGAGWWLVGHSFAPPPPSDSVAGVTVELDPVSVPAPPTIEPKPLQDNGPGPDKQLDERPDAPPEPLLPPPAVEPAPPAVEPPPPTEPPPVEAAVAVPPEPTPPIPLQKPDPAPPSPAPLPEVVPPAAPAPSDAVLAPPPPRPMPVKRVAPPKPPKPAPLKPDPREIARQEAREAAVEARQEARAKAAAEARAQRHAAQAEARAARTAAAREGGGTDRESAAPTPASSGAAASAWNGELIAHLRAYTPTSPNGATGTVKVQFSVDRGGRITSASVASSSGDPQLDQAALSAVRRASPVPPPPPELGGRLSRSVPVHFK